MKTSMILMIPMLCLAQTATRESGIRAFHDIATVLTSPRCLNCHVPGDHPLQGDDSHSHTMKIARGIDGAGSNPAARCANCHQDANVVAAHAPPGASGWRMPSAAVRMAWQGLTTAKLCEVLKNPQTNGKKSLAALVEHASSDQIVLWGWNPGPGRSLPPLPHQQFVDSFKTWVAAGAPCPE